MKSVLHAHVSSYLATPNISKLKLDYRFCRKQSLSLKLSNGRLRKSVTVFANNNKTKKNEETHSSVPKPNESTWFFPEAVLLKKKKLQEEGKVLPEFADDEEEELYEYLNLELESDLDVTEMRHYEVVYLIHEKHVEEVEKINQKIQDFVKEKKGKIWRFSDWGLRRLSYKIQKATHAHYILMNFEFEAKWINDFKTMLDKDERIIRHLVIKKDEAETEDCPPPPEFDTLRADMNDNGDEDNFDYDEEDEGEELDEEDEIDGFSGELEDNIIDVDSYDDGEEYEDVESVRVADLSVRNSRSKKVAR